MRKFSADFRRVVSIFIVAAAFALTAYAQDLTDYQTSQKNISSEESGALQTGDAFDKKNEFAVWSGFAPDIPRRYSYSRCDNTYSRN